MRKQPLSRTKSGTRRLVRFALMAACMLPAGARGQARGVPSSDPQEDVLNRQGVEARRHNDDQGALHLFRRAYGLHKSPRAAAQMGLAEIALGQWEAADTHLDEALAASEDPWIHKNEPVLREASSRVKSQFGEMQVLGEPAGAEIVIEGRIVGTTPTSESLPM